MSNLSPEILEYKREEGKKAYRKLKELGICIKCRKKKSFKCGRCIDCYKKFSAYQKRIRPRQDLKDRRAKLKAIGACVNCGPKVKAMPEKCLCKKCQDKHTECQKRRRERNKLKTPEWKHTIGEWQTLIVGKEENDATRNPV